MIGPDQRQSHSRTVADKACAILVRHRNDPAQNGRETLKPGLFGQCGGDIGQERIDATGPGTEGDDWSRLCPADSDPGPLRTCARPEYQGGFKLGAGYDDLRKRLTESGELQYQSESPG